jgi:hypothetical protein
VLIIGDVPQLCEIVILCVTEASVDVLSISGGVGLRPLPFSRGFLLLSHGHGWPHCAYSTALATESR